jgi:hypothetical protein
VVLLTKTCETVVGPPPLDFEAYQRAATAAYEQLLDSATSERPLQEFLERNPCFVPAARSPGSHGPLHGALIAQPRLPGLRVKQPDFMWITAHSLIWFPTLIEIESPTKQLFTKKGLPTKEFTQARNQLAQWRAWFSKETNRLKFIDDYGISEEFRKFRTMKPRYVLIYGRRREFEDDAELSGLRAEQLTDENEELVSFDRLKADCGMRNAVTVRALGGGRYQVRFVMPTFRLCAPTARDLLHLEGLEQAIDRERRIESKRRSFLKARIPYWRDWAKRPGREIVSVGDCE